MKHTTFSGFSLSEVLIATAIIGIIAAITIPTVVASYQKQTMLSLLQKTYLELGENLMILSTEAYNKTFYQSLLSLQGRSIANTAGKFFMGDADEKGYYSVIKDCETTAQPCFADTYANLNGTKNEAFSCSEGYNVLIKSGTAMCIIPADGGNPAEVHVDVNGPEGPNIGGRDMFTFYIYDDYSIDEKDIGPDKIKDNTAKDAREALYTKSCKVSTIGEGCFGKLLNDNWKMNY